MSKISLSVISFLNELEQRTIGLMSRVFPMVRDTGVQSQVESYEGLKKWYSIQPCLALSTIRCGLRVKWSNPGNRVASSPTYWCSSYWKRSLRVTLDKGRQLYLVCITVGIMVRLFANCSISGWVFYKDSKTYIHRFNLILSRCRLEFLQRAMAERDGYYLPTPPLGQDMTQSQFLSGV